MGSVTCVTVSARRIEHGYTFTKEQITSNPNSEPKFSKYELNDEQLEKATGGYASTRNHKSLSGSDIAI